MARILHGRSTTNQLLRGFAPSLSHVRRLDEGRCASPGCDQPAKFLLLWEQPVLVITGNRTEYEHSAELCEAHAAARRTEARQYVRLTALPEAAR